MTNKHDPNRNEYMLTGSFARKGYDWWWHSFTARNERTGEECPFFVEFFTCNPQCGGKEPVFGQLQENKDKKVRPSYLMVKAGFWGKEHAQLHRFFAWDDVSIHAEAPYSVTAGDCFASDEMLKGSRTQFTAEETDTEILWHVRQETFCAVMVTEVRCNKSDMLLVNYEAPDGTKRHNRLWNGGNGTGTVELYRKTRKGTVLIDRITAEKVGCEYGEYDN